MNEPDSWIQLVHPLNRLLQFLGRYIQGVIDMAIETRFLSFIEHPNIIKLRAVAKCEPIDQGYFIVMDRLFDILEKRIESWGSKLKRFKGLKGRMTDPKGLKTKAIQEEQMVSAYDLAAAINHLHSRKVSRWRK